MKGFIRGYAQHKVITAASLFCIAFYALEYTMSPIADVHSAIAGMAYNLALVLLPLYPVVCSTVLCALSMVCSVMPLMFGGPQEYPGVWLALGVLGFLGNVAYMAVVGCLPIIGTTEDIVSRFGGQSGVLVSLVAIDGMYIICMLVGMGARRWGERQAHIASQKAAYERQQEQLRLLHSAHDSIAGKLAGALMVCRLHERDSANAQDWGTVALLLQQSLGELRENIINPVKKATGYLSAGSVDRSGMVLRLHNTVNELSSMMSLLHFDGDIIVSGSPEVFPTDKLNVCVDILREVHTNIIQHGMIGVYSTLIEFGDDAIVHITSSNQVSNKNDHSKKVPG